MGCFLIFFIVKSNSLKKGGSFVRSPQDGHGRAFKLSGFKNTPFPLKDVIKSRRVTLHKSLHKSLHPFQVDS